jgi:glycosyltransferase involved in cell wall biosynthesis
MRIALVTGEYPPLEGGVGDFTHQLGRTLANQGCEIHVLTCCESDTGGESVTEEAEGVKVHRKVDNWSWGVHNYIKRWIDEVTPDVVNIQYQTAAYEMRVAINLFPRWQGRHVRPPIVTTFHDLRPPYLFPKAGALRQWSVWQMADYSDGVIVTNGEDYASLTERTKREGQPALRLIHIGSNIAPNPPSDYDRERWRAEHGFGADDLVLGFFGFLNRSKGVETLLRGMARLVEQGLPAHLIFIGGRTGSSDITNRAYAKEVDALVESLGLKERVRSTGFTSPAGVSAALLASDICVLPYRDGASLRRGTLHASLAHGCPLVTTRPTVPTSPLRHGDNLLTVPPEDPEALAEAIARLWNTPELREELGRHAAELAAEFSWDRIASHTAEFFRQLIHG